MKCDLPPFADIDACVDKDDDEGDIVVALFLDLDILLIRPILRKQYEIIQVAPMFLLYFFVS